MTFLQKKSHNRNSKKTEYNRITVSNVIHHNSQEEKAERVRRIFKEIYLEGNYKYAMSN